MSKNIKNLPKKLKRKHKNLTKDLQFNEYLKYCLFCDADFDSQNALSQHILNVHFEETKEFMKFRDPFLQIESIKDDDIISMATYEVYLRQVGLFKINNLELFAVYSGSLDGIKEARNSNLYLETLEKYERIGVLFSEVKFVDTNLIISCPYCFEQHMNNNKMDAHLYYNHGLSRTRPMGGVIWPENDLLNVASMEADVIKQTSERPASNLFMSILNRKMAYIDSFRQSIRYLEMLKLKLEEHDIFYSIEKLQKCICKECNKEFINYNHYAAHKLEFHDPNGVRKIAEMVASIDYVIPKEYIESAMKTRYSLMKRVSKRVLSSTNNIKAKATKISLRNRKQDSVLNVDLSDISD